MDSLWERRQATRQRLGAGGVPDTTVDDLDETGSAGPATATVHVGSPPPTTESDPHGHIAAVVNSLARTTSLDQGLDVLLAPSPDAPRTRITKTPGSPEIHVRLVVEKTSGVSSVAADLADALRGLR